MSDRLSERTLALLSPLAAARVRPRVLCVWVLAGCVAVSQELGEGEVEAKARYGLESIHIRPAADYPADVDPVLLGPYERGGLWQLAQYGEFTELAPGDTLELAAIRAGRDIGRVRRLNRVSPTRELPPYLCLSFGHRVLPGETLDGIAEVHDTDVETLIELNDLDARDPEPWSKILVPARMTHQRGRTNLQIVIPQWRLFDELEFEQSLVLHEIEEGESWQSIADEYGTTDRLLRSVNPNGGEVVVIGRQVGFLGRLLGGANDAVLVEEAAADDGTDDGPIAGRRINTALRLNTEGIADLVPLVLYLEYFLYADLDGVLDLNGVVFAEELLDLDAILVPFSAPGGFPTMTFGEHGGVSLYGGPGANVSLGVMGGGDGELVISVEITGR